MSFDCVKRDVVVGIGCSNNTQISLIERKMHVVEAKEVEERDLCGLRCRLTRRSINLSQS
jgi:hypothetical protein